MPIEKIFAHATCSDLAQSRTWFERLFGRQPDALPMQGLVEWHHGETAGFQLFEDASNAGRSSTTLIVRDLLGEQARLRDAGLNPAEIEKADFANLLMLRDPDGNLIVLAEPGSQRQ